MPAAGETLRRVLAENRHFAPVLRGGSICNHYSMGMLAAHGLGADDKQLAYLHHFLEGRSRAPHDAADTTRKEATRGGEGWTWGLGQMTSMSAMRGFFLEELQEKGLDATLRAYLPRLILGQHKGLFHPMIRLKFGMLSPCDPLEEIAEALAYSYGRYQPIFPSAPDRFAAELATVDEVQETVDESTQALLEGRIHKAWARLRQMYKARGFNGRKNTMGILAELYEDEALHGVSLEGFPVDPASAAEGHLLATQLAAQLYKYQPGLTTLHAITGAHAVSDILPKLPSGARVASAKLYFLWLSCLFVEKGCPQLRFFSHGAELVAAGAWQRVRDRALEPLCEGSGHSHEEGEGSGEEPQVHVLKLAFTCERLFERSAHPIYLDIAKKVVGEGKPW